LVPFFCYICTVTDHNDDVFKAKRKPKNPIKFKLQLNEEQKVAKAVILDKAITVVTGAAGSGKTLLATATGLDMLFSREVEKIVITRPMVSAGEDMGFLPGDVAEKMDPWLQPIYQNLYALYGKDKIDKEMSEGRIQILPMGYVRGITFVDTFIIADEIQNLTDNQTQALLGRLGHGSKMVLVGDASQIDLKNKKSSGISFLRRVDEQVDDFAIVKLNSNHRHDVVDKILEVYRLYCD
jgi:phosphate starvation-inducible protein PhoH and related proteins